MDTTRSAIEGSASYQERVAQSQNRRVVVFAEGESQISQLVEGFVQVQPADVEDIFIWVNIERFRAPSSTPLPYRRLARTEARNITAERVASGEAKARDASPVLSRYGHQVNIEAFVEASPATVAVRIEAERIDLMVCGSEPDGIGALAAARAGRPLLLVPSHSASETAVSFGQAPRSRPETTA